MPPIAKILFPVDFSHGARRAAPFVAAFAERFAAAVNLVHVLPAEEEPPPGALPRARERLSGFLAGELSGCGVCRDVLEGDPAREIVRTAGHQGCGLIMVPSRGSGQYRRLLLGSVAAKVLHDAGCAVWTSAHGAVVAQVRAEPSHIVCGVDMGVNSLRAVEWARALAEAFDARLTLLHVVEGLDPRVEYYRFSHQWRQQLVHGSIAELEAIRRAHAHTADVHVAVGELQRTVASEMVSLGGDLLVIARPPEGHQRGRLTSRAYSIICESPCPVLSV